MGVGSSAQHGSDMTTPSDDKYAELYAAVGELDQIFVSIDAGREARRVAADRMLAFFEAQLAEPTRLFGAPLEGDTAKQPETFPYDHKLWCVDRHSGVSSAPLQKHP